VAAAAGQKPSGRRLAARDLGFRLVRLSIIGVGVGVNVGVREVAYWKEPAQGEP
jgi:hypothetical protein